MPTTNKKPTLNDKLVTIQQNLHAKKDLKNSFGNYNYRNLESILEALKPHLETTKTTVTINDDMVMVGDRIYVKATICLNDSDGNSICTSAFAWEMPRKGMDSSQCTGSASSYARKYAANGLFAIDNTDDADSRDNSKTKYVAKHEIERALAALDKHFEAGDAKSAKAIYAWAEKQEPPVVQVQDRYFMLFGDES